MVSSKASNFATKNRAEVNASEKLWNVKSGRVKGKSKTASDVNAEFVNICVAIHSAGLASAYYFESRQNKIEEDHSLKYRYIKIKGDVSAEQIAKLKDIFELNRDSEKIEQMREDVETNEEAVRKQAVLAEQVRLKEQAATAKG